MTYVIKSITRSLMVFAALAILLACSATANKPDTSKTVRAAIISVRHNNITIPKHASFRWEANHIKFYHDERLAHADIEMLLQQSIETTLIAKGYRYQPTASQTDFVIAYAAALESSLSNDAIQQHFGLQPGLINQNTQFHEKGTVIVDIIDASSAKLVWRTAGQAVATLKDIPESLRKQRIEQFIQQLLSGLPDDLQ